MPVLRMPAMIRTVARRLHPWLAWLFVHLMNLVGYQNRLLVFLQWTWNYVTHNRAARLITGASPFPLRRER